MIQLSSFNVVHYRGINGLTVPQLSKANLITGTNGIGKTALIEAIWLFSGRYHPSLLWNANVQRSFIPPLDPISQLTDGELVLRGQENGIWHEMKFVFERIDGTSTNLTIADAIQQDAKSLPPVVGFIRVYLDGEQANDGPEGIHLTPFGVVLHQSPKASTERSSCVIESTRFQREAPTEYLQRYSNLVREGHKKELVKTFQYSWGKCRGCGDIDRRPRRVLSVGSDY